ncbi:hypothetical protein AB1Y20_016867 [Prymnesium parvum]|uniref:DOT1 domain-containing protein n=1 Tax=Prymnesium parvum TaxID=97485 RepID=A0AB34IA82_PRYPA
MRQPRPSHLRAGELDSTATAQRCVRALTGIPGLADELRALTASLHRDSPLVVAAVRLHGACPLGVELGQLDAPHALGACGARPPTPPPPAAGGKVASLRPRWAELWRRQVHESRALRLCCSPLSQLEELRDIAADNTMHWLTIHSQGGGGGCLLRWCCPPQPGRIAQLLAAPAVFVALHAAHEGGGEPGEEDAAAGLLCRPLDTDSERGDVFFDAEELAAVACGCHAFALHCMGRVVATSQLVHIGEHGVTAIADLRGYSSPVLDHERLGFMTSGPRQDPPHAAGASPHQYTSRDADDHSDERQMFPVPLVTVQLQGASFHADLLKLAYKQIDQFSHLNWGLTSDYDAGVTQEQLGFKAKASRRQAAECAEACISVASARLFSTVRHAVARRPHEPRGLGGNTKGSEGYGELTLGSLSRLLALLVHLRSTVLSRLYAGQWPRVFDLRSDATFCDVGSGYGKVVIHCALETYARSVVGIECVISRHELAEQARPQPALVAQALQELRVRLLCDPSLVGCEMSAEPAASKACTAPPATNGAADTPRGEGHDGVDTLGASSVEGSVEATGGGVDGSSEASASSCADSTQTRQHEELSAAAHPRIRPADPFVSVYLHFGDATVGNALNFTHVYAFDRVFSPVTLRALAKLLLVSPWYVFVSFRTPSEWWDHGLHTAQPVAKLQVRTTGSEGLTARIYINALKLPDPAGIFVHQAET